MKKMFLLGLVLAAMLVFFTKNSFQVLSFLQNLLDWIKAQGPWAPLLYILFYSAGTFLFFPLVVLAMSGGLLFDFMPGAIIVSAASLIAATLGYLAGRYGSGWCSGKIQKHAPLQAATEAVRREGWKIVILSRLSAILPFMPLNCAYGLGGLRYKDFIWGTWIGMMPGIFLNVSLGSAAGSLMGLRHRPFSFWEGAFYSVSILASLMGTYTMTALTRKILKNSQGSSEKSDECVKN